jgi:hypothetical protein
MATTTPPTKRRRQSSQAGDRGTPGTLVVFSDPPRTIIISRAATHIELGGRSWAVHDDEDKSTLCLGVTTISDDSEGALREVLAVRSHEALQRKNDAWALNADIERLMERARKVCSVVVFGWVLTLTLELVVCVCVCVCV